MKISVFLLHVLCINVFLLPSLASAAANGSLTVEKKAASGNITIHRQKQRDIVGDQRLSHEDKYSSTAEEEPAKEQTATITEPTQPSLQTEDALQEPKTVTFETPAPKTVVIQKQPKSPSPITQHPFTATSNTSTIISHPTNSAIIKIEVNMPEERKPKQRKLEAVIVKEDIITKLWKLYSAGKFDQVKREIALKIKSDPHWKQPQDLNRLMALVSADQQLLKAQQKGDYAAALSMYQKTPEAFNCDRLGWALFLAEGQVRAGLKQAADHTYQRLLGQCDTEQRLASLEHAHGVLPRWKWQPLVKREMTRRHAHSASQQARLDKTWYNILLQNVQIASDKRDNKQSILLADTLQPRVMAYKDSGSASLLAWVYFRAEKFEKALGNFNYAYEKTGNPDALRGRALTLAQLKRFDQLNSLIDDNHAAMVKEDMLKDFLPILAGHALTVQNYQRALKLLLELEAIRPLTLGEMSLKAWALYHSESYTEAADTFEALYRIKNDEEVARGLYYSLQRAGDYETMYDLEEDFDGAYKVMVNRLHTDQLYYHGQYLAVHDRDESYGSNLKNIDEPYVRATYMAKFVQGAPIFSRMVLRKAMLEGWAVPSGAHALNVRYEHFSLDAGPGSLAQDLAFKVGTIAQPLMNFPNAKTRHTGSEWSIGYSHEGEGTSFLEVGQLLASNGIKADFKLRAGYARSFDGKNFQIEAYRQPLRETMISYIGMLDPYQGIQRWGQVSRNGGKLKGYYALGYDFSLSGHVIGEVRSGHHVKNNPYYSSYLGLSYNLGLPYTNYFAVGPYVRYEHSSMNQNHTTIGHGNYFSPQYLLDLGIGASLMTELNKSWLLSVNASFGQQKVRETVSPYFPLANNGITWPSATNKEYHYQYDAALVFAPFDKWRISAEYKQSRSWSLIAARAIKLRAVMDRAFMVNVTFHFQDRGKQLLRRDIPSFGLNPLY